MPTDHVGEDEHVTREGLIFRAGAYPDKDFSMSADEARAAVEAFSSPVPVGLEHTPNVLDSKMGHVQSIRLGEDGQSIFGRICLPKWLDALLADGERKVSAEWCRATKTLRKLDLVLSPRVTDAALFAAFSEAHPDAAPDLATFTPRKMSPDATRHMQGIHDHVAAVAPDVCAGGSAAFADRPKQIKAFKAVHDTAVAHGAVCKGVAAMSATSSPAPEPKAMGFLDRMNQTYFGGKAKNVPALSPEVDAELAAAFADLEPEAKPALVVGKIEPAPAPVKFSDTPEGKQMAAEIERLRAESDANRKAAVARDADQFAAGLVKDGRIPAAFAADCSALFARLSDDDRSASAVVAFSGAAGPAEGTRLDALKALFGRVPTAAERFTQSTKGKAVFSAEGVPTEPIEGANFQGDTPNAENVARLMKLAGVDA